MCRVCSDAPRLPPELSSHSPVVTNDDNNHRRSSNSSHQHSSSRKRHHGDDLDDSPHRSHDEKLQRRSHRKKTETPHSHSEKRSHRAASEPKDTDAKKPGGTAEQSTRKHRKSLARAKSETPVAPNSKKYKNLKVTVVNYSSSEDEADNIVTVQRTSPRNKSVRNYRSKVSASTEEKDELAKSGDHVKIADGVSTGDEKSLRKNRQTSEKKTSSPRKKSK